MPVLKINFNDTLDCTPKRMFVNGNKARNQIFKGYEFEIAKGNPVKIRILNSIQSKKEKLYFCFCAFFDITSSSLRDFLDRNSMMFLSEYEIVLTDDAEIEVETTKDGFIITEHSDTCKIISEKHKKEEIPERLLQTAMAPIFIFTAMILISLLAGGILGLIQGNHTVSATMFSIMFVLTLLFGYGLKKTFQK